MRSFKSLSEQEILALAISLEEEDARIYDDFADGLKEQLSRLRRRSSAAMRQEEDGHRHRLLELYREQFGDHIPLIRRQDVKGFVNRKPVWLVRPLGLTPCARRPRDDGSWRRSASTRRPRAERPTQACANCWAIWPRRNASTRASPSRMAAERIERRKRRRRKRDFRAASGAAGPGRVDGRLGFDARAAVRGGVRHAQQQGDISGRPGRQRRRGHQHGFRRGAVRRRQPDRTRSSVGARRRLRPDDRAGRPRPHAAVPDSEREALSPRPSPSASCSSNWWSSPGFAIASWIRR